MVIGGSVFAPYTLVAVIGGYWGGLFLKVGKRRRKWLRRNEIVFAHPKQTAQGDRQTQTVFERCRNNPRLQMTRRDCFCGGLNAPKMRMTKRDCFGLPHRGSKTRMLKTRLFLTKTDCFLTILIVFVSGSICPKRRMTNRDCFGGGWEPSKLPFAETRLFLVRPEQRPNANDKKGIVFEWGWTPRK